MSHGIEYNPKTKTLVVEKPDSYATGLYVGSVGVRHVIDQLVEDGILQPKEIKLAWQYYEEATDKLAALIDDAARRIN